MVLTRPVNVLREQEEEQEGEVCGVLEVPPTHTDLTAKYSATIIGKRLFAAPRLFLKGP